MRPVHWIETELARHYEDLELNRGVDLDRNGAIDGTEKIDQDGDGQVDSAEWQKFMGDNRAALKKLDGHFKAYYSAGIAFKPDNPIHDLLFIESDIASQNAVVETYKKLEKMLRLFIYTEEFFKEHHAESELTPEDNLSITLTVMKGGMFEYGLGSESFVKNIEEGVVECFSSSFVVFAIGQELNWPVHLVRAPKHVFVRWDDGEGKRFSMDMTDWTVDSGPAISQTAADQGIYMRNMEYHNVLSMIYFNRGNVKMEDGRLEEARADYDKALEFDPKNAEALTNRGNIKFELGRNEEARADYEKARALDPVLASIQPPLSCLCEAVGQADSVSTADRSLLSLLMMLFD